MPENTTLLTEEDKHLISVYWLGWEENSKGNVENKAYMYVNKTEKKAYQLGWDHFVIGDDVRSVDYLSKEQILERIKAK